MSFARYKTPRSYFAKCLFWRSKCFWWITYAFYKVAPHSLKTPRSYIVKCLFKRNINFVASWNASVAEITHSEVASRRLSLAVHGRINTSKLFRKIWFVGIRILLPPEKLLLLNISILGGTFEITSLAAHGLKTHWSYFITCLLASTEAFHEVTNTII